MKKTLQQFATIALTSSAILFVSFQPAQAGRNPSSLRSAASMAQMRFGQKTDVSLSMRIEQKVYAADILLVCESLDKGNSLREIGSQLIPAYAKAFNDYALGVHYFESIAKYGTMNYCNEHMTQAINIDL